MSSAAAPSVRHWQLCGGNGANPISGSAHESYTLLGTEDTTIEAELDLGYCIILKVGNTGDMAANGDYQLQIEVNGTGGFANVDAGSSNVRVVATGDSDDATSTTERLGTSAETFQTSVLDEGDGLQVTNVSGHNEHEFYFAFEFRSADLTAGEETIEFRLTTGGSTFDHTAVEPIDITLPAGKKRVRKKLEEIVEDTVAEVLEDTSERKTPIRRVSAKRRQQILVDATEKAVDSQTFVTERVEAVEQQVRSIIRRQLKERRQAIKDGVLEQRILKQNLERAQRLADEQEAEDILAIIAMAFDIEDLDEWPVLGEVRNRTIN